MSSPYFSLADLPGKNLANIDETSSITISPKFGQVG